MSFNNNNLNNNSFDNTLILKSNELPKLVDNKILKKIKKKKIQIKKNTSINKIKNNCSNFIKNNYGILIILVILGLLLYYRYQDVQQKRKNKTNI